MKILNQVQAILNKCELKSFKSLTGHENVYSYLNENPELRNNYEPEKDDFYFLNKYKKYISEGHYGFSIGTPTPPEWNEIIDEILQLCITVDPKFEIQQIKTKFGGIRFYVQSEIIEDIFDVEILIEQTLFDKAFIY